MTDILETASVTVNLLHFELIRKNANLTTAHVDFTLGADAAKRFEADVAECVNGDGDVVTRGKRLQKICDPMCTRLQAYHDEGREVKRQLVDQLQACTAAANSGQADVWIDKLNDGEKKEALVLAMKLAAQYKREQDAASDDGEAMIKNHMKFLEESKNTYRKAAKDLAALADSAKASLDAATEACARSDKALQPANEKVAQLEKEASKTGARIAEAVHDMQKLAYEKEDPDRPAGSTIQQKPLLSLVRTVQALKRASHGKATDVVAPNCADCQTFKVQANGLEKTLETQQKEIDKLLGDKKDLLEDRKRDKVEMERLNEKMAKPRAENAAEKPKKRNK